MVIEVPTKPRQVPDLKQRDVRETANIGAVPTIADFTSAQHDHSNAPGGGTTAHAAASNPHTNSADKTGETFTGSIVMDDGAGDSPTTIYVNGSDHTATMLCQNTSGDLNISTSTGGIELAPGDGTIDFGTSTVTGAITFGNVTIAADHGTGLTDQIVNVCYGTGAPPAASTTTEGTLFIQYVN